MKKKKPGWDPKKTPIRKTTNKKKSPIAGNGPLIIGKMMKHKNGFGFVIPEEEGQGADVFVSRSNMKDTMNGDRVSVRVAYEEANGAKREGFIEEILTRGTLEIIGSFETSKAFGFVVPDDKRQNEDVYVRRKDFNGAQKGDKVVVTLTKYPEKGSNPEGKITEIISRSGEAGGDIKALIRSYNLSPDFPGRVRSEASVMAGEEISESLAGRRDLTDKKVITIDGPDAKDLDDGISIEKTPSGNTLLGVHIADVSHYVREGGQLDKEALKRGTSVYLIDQVIPMLPAELSNGACSLNPGVDRLTLSVDMEIDSTGKVIRHEIYESVIRSWARMTYDDVSDILEKDAVDLISRYTGIIDELHLMEELASILRKKRLDRGSLDFDLNEAAIVLDEKGVPVSVEIIERRTANKMIEEFMLAANETVAEHYFWKELPFLYRIHEKPDPEKMEEFKAFIGSFGCSMKGNVESIHPKELSRILKQIEGESYERVVNTVMLRSMKKAFYGTECQGHFGLGVRYYCHFTSPIRRYPDLMIHRIIKETLKGELAATRIRKYQKATEEASKIASATERKAQELERDVEKLKKAQYMENYVGQIFDGVISGVSGFGFYVELPDTIEGMVRASTIKDDYYQHEAAFYRLRGAHTNKTYSLGDRVRVLVEKVNVQDGEIDFLLAEEEVKE
jgi:ribonuclease R